MPHRLCVNSVAKENLSATYEYDGFVGIPFTGFKISNKQFLYNATHKASFIMVELTIGAEFVEGTF